jgi:hypothetical protein
MDFGIFAHGTNMGAGSPKVQINITSSAKQKWQGR